VAHPDLVEEIESGCGLGLVDHTRLGEKPEVAVDLFCRAVCDPSMVEAISTDPPVTFWA